ncbi:MAG: hypothetical protein KBA61_09020 [Spirochaetes bacterium]|nr:hypothetical protein [Spirochaetota bacterium]
MQFFALIMINAAMFAIFYLLISLKLERKATEFREKKLRRLMEEMISDFNETAERNISLLEHRINTMKRLLNAKNGLSSLDVSVDDIPAEELREVYSGESSREGTSAEHGTGARETNARAKSAVTDVITQGAGALAGKLRRLVAKAVDTAIHATAAREGAQAIDPGAEQASTRQVPKADSLIARELSSLRGEPNKETAPAALPDEEEIAGLFKKAGDKYALVGDLYGKGCSVELISRCSGIPQGEIRLVLNLGM